MGLRNLREKLSNQRGVFGLHKIGYTGAEIVARSAQVAGDSGPGLLNQFAVDPVARYAIRIGYNTIPGYGMSLHEDGSLYASSHGAFKYAVYRNNQLIVPEDA